MAHSSQQQKPVLQEVPIDRFENVLRELQIEMRNHDGETLKSLLSWLREIDKMLQKI